MPVLSFCVILFSYLCFSSNNSFIFAKHNHRLIMLKWCFALILVLLLSCSARVQAAESAVSERDSAMVAYYKKCKAYMDSPVVLEMCDTLLQLSKEKKDPYMQVMAECIRLDYFYYRNDEKNIIRQVHAVRALSRQLNQLKFYYFSWGSRLITYYVKQHKVNLALYEAKKMLQMAQEDEYYPGMAECYNVLAKIYITQSNSQLAYENFQKTIDIIEQHQLPEINLPTNFASMAQCALELKLYDEAEKALKKALPLATTPYQNYTVKKGFVLFYLEKNDLENAWKYIQEIEEMFQKHKELSVYIVGLHYIKIEYYRAMKQYNKALAMIYNIINDTTPLRSKYMDYSLTYKLGNIYWDMNNKEKAAAFYRDYIEATDSIRTQEIQNSANEFSSIMEVEQLKNERSELQLSVKEEQLQLFWLVLLFLLILGLLGGLLFFRIYKLNKQLKVSEVTVSSQNQDLKVFAEELGKAKERAENASLMKTNFIQNMSHEIRTPLNSIVGFSQLLAGYYEDNLETKEFASIIETNSKNLLSLVNDVLDISYLDQSEELPYDAVVEMNSCCQSSVDLVRASLKEGVELYFTPPCEELMVKANQDRLSQILNHLLQNAAKFTIQGSITLAYVVKAEERQIVYTVTDTGKGIPQDKQNFVFERFAKLDDFTQGTGLGLPICRLVAEKLGGSLVIDRNYTQGCRFVLTLPLVYA